MLAVTQESLFEPDILVIPFEVIQTAETAGVIFYVSDAVFLFSDW